MLNITSSLIQIDDYIPQTMQEVLDGNHREELMEFLKGHHAEECLEFYEKIEEYESLETPDERNRLGKWIVNNFVKTNSPASVNIAAGTRVDILKTNDFQPDTFARGKQEILTLMSCNFLAKFQNVLQGREDSSILPDEEEVLPRKATEVSVSKRAGVGSVKRGNTRKDSSMSKFFSSLKSASTTGKKLIEVAAINDSSGNLSKQYSTKRTESLSGRKTTKKSSFNEYNPSHRSSRGTSRGTSPNKKSTMNLGRQIFRNSRGTMGSKRFSFFKGKNSDS